MLIESKESLNIEQRIQLIIETAQICVFEFEIKNLRYLSFENAEAIYEKSGKIILEEIQKFYALERDEYLNMISDYFTHPEDHWALKAALISVMAGKSASCYARMRTEKAQFIWCKVDIMPISGCEPVSAVGVISNVDRLMRQCEEYRKKSESDSLTGLLNKKYLEQNISQIFNNDANRRHALIMMDLDDFKSVNDNYGHRAGDEVLRQTSERIHSIFRRTDLVGRWGGDEFVVLMTDIPDEEILINKIEKLLEPLDCSRLVTKSIGVALFPEHGQELAELFSKADAALYEAKKNKNHFEIYNEKIGKKAAGIVL